MTTRSFSGAVLLYTALFALPLIGAGCAAESASPTAGANIPDPDFPDPNPGIEPSPDPQPDANPGMNPDPNPDPNPVPSPDPQPDAEPDFDGPENYNYNSLGSRISTLSVVLDSGVGVDLNEDDLPDNAMANLLQDLSSIIGSTDLNGQLATSLEDGSLNIGTKWPTLNMGVSDHENVEVHFFDLVANEGDYSATRDSFEANSSQPRISFMDAAIRERVLTAGPSQFQITLPIGALEVTSTIEKAYLAGDLFEDDLGVGMTEGSLAGAVPLDSVVSSINDYLSSEACSCLGLETPLMDLSQGVGPQACSPDYTTETCEALDQQLCATIAGACMLVVSVLDGQTDIDLDRDGEPDAISLFMRLTMDGALIEGPEP